MSLKKGMGVAQEDRHTFHSAKTTYQKTMASALTDDSTIDLTTETPTTILDEALSLVATAIAALHRAGPAYSHHSEPFWHFAAGTWSPFYYQHRVAEAVKKLPPNVGVQQDISMAVHELQQAVALLREFGDERDADDLEDATCQFLSNAGGGL